jgi:hypothetical protein
MAWRATRTLSGSGVRASCAPTTGSTATPAWASGMVTTQTWRGEQCGALCSGHTSTPTSGASCSSVVLIVLQHCRCGTQRLGWLVSRLPAAWQIHAVVGGAAMILVNILIITWGHHCCRCLTAAAAGPTSSAATLRRGCCLSPRLSCCMSWALRRMSRRPSGCAGSWT